MECYERILAPLKVSWRAMDAVTGDGHELVAVHLKRPGPARSSGLRAQHETVQSSTRGAELGVAVQPFHNGLCEGCELPSSQVNLAVKIHYGYRGIQFRSKADAKPGSTESLHSADGLMQG